MLRLPRFNLTHPDKYFALGGNVVRSLARFFVSLLIARLAGNQVYGGFVLLASAEIIVLSIITSLFVAPMVTMGPGRSAEERAALTALAFRRTVRWSIVIGLVALSSLPLALRFEVTPLAFVGFCLTTSLSCVGAASRGWRQAEFASRRAFWADAIGLATPVAAVAMGAVAGLPVTTVYWLASAVGAALTLWRLGCPDLAPLASLDTGISRRFARMGLHMTLGTLGNTVCSRIQPFVLAAAGGSQVVAMFGGAALLIGPIRLLSMTMSNVLRPRLSWHLNQGRLDEVRRIVLIAIGGFLAVGLPAIAGAAALGDWAAVLIFGDDYRDVAPILPWAAAFAMLEAIGATLVVLAQTALPNGAACATALRTATTVAALAIVWPACSRFGAAGAFAAAAAIELLFVGLMTDRVLRDHVLTLPRSAVRTG
jgi:O-antigen/teichoic acid export membrane protein